jgi:hypothetical protein
MCMRAWSSTHATSKRQTSSPKELELFFGQWLTGIYTRGDEGEQVPSSVVNSVVKFRFWGPAGPFNVAWGHDKRTILELHSFVMGSFASPPRRASNGSDKPWRRGISGESRAALTVSCRRGDQAASGSNHREFEELPHLPIHGHRPVVLIFANSTSPCRTIPADVILALPDRHLADTAS